MHLLQDLEILQQESSKSTEELRASLDAMTHEKASLEAVRAVRRGPAVGGRGAGVGVTARSKVPNACTACQVPHLQTGSPAPSDSGCTHCPSSSRVQVCVRS